MEFDLLLLRPPSFYDYRTTNLFRSPIGDVVPSSFVFDMYPDLPALQDICSDSAIRHDRQDGRAYGAL